MKIQDVKKECTAIVGLSIEFSNSEVDSIISLVRDLNITIQKGKADPLIKANNELTRAQYKGSFSGVTKQNVLKNRRLRRGVLVTLLPISVLIWCTLFYALY